MNWREAQAAVERAVRAAGGYWPEFVILIRLGEEVGEVGRALRRRRGYGPSSGDEDLAAEVGDVLFTLAAFANQQGLSLDICLAKALEKADR